MDFQRARVGQFFLFAGLVSLIVFVASVRAHDPQYLCFFGGFFILIVGIIFIWSDIKPPPENPRFRRVRTWREKRAEKKKKAQKK
jgi:hypothetical protein